MILGTMYSFDIFAAVPCCPDRLKVQTGRQAGRKLGGQTDDIKRTSEASLIKGVNKKKIKQKKSKAVSPFGKYNKKVFTYMFQFTLNILKYNNKKLVVDRGLHLHPSPPPGAEVQLYV